MEYTLIILDHGQCLTVGYELNIALLTVGTQDLIGCHAQIEVVRKPDFIHEENNLQGENVLTEVIAVFKEEGEIGATGLLVKAGDAEGDLLRGEYCHPLV